MNTRTLTALYEDRADADAAAGRLKGNGFANVSIHDQTDKKDAVHEGLLDKILDFLGGSHDAHAYGEAVRRGHYLLMAKVNEERATEAALLMDACNPVDFHSAKEAFKSDGWVAPVATRAPVAAEPVRIGALDEKVGGGEGVRAYVVDAAPSAA